MPHKVTHTTNTAARNQYKVKQNTTNIHIKFIFFQITKTNCKDKFHCQLQKKQEAQLPQRNSASATHMEGG